MEGGVMSEIWQIIEKTDTWQEVVMLASAGTMALLFVGMVVFLVYGVFRAFADWGKP